MKKILFLLILTTFTYATNLLTHNIYDREDRVDIMLSFDSPYAGQIFQDKSQHTISLKLADLSFNQSIKKTINSKIIQALSIVPNKNNLIITLTSKKSIDVIASKTTDGFGLRIRAKLAKPIADSTINALSQNNTNVQDIKTFQDSSLIDTRYIIVVTFLFILLIIMIWLKRRVTKAVPEKKQRSWLFKNIVPKSADIKIIHKKPIDPKNSLIVLEYENKRYLVMSGNSNVLLDTFGSQDLENGSDFEQAFEDNRKKLDEYLKLQDRKLEDYKDKASNEYLYEQN
ncbi:MAG: hypothetical protein R3331_07985 [Sulfurospirillaceae bacterium]|nr:hypothetical protein [Sulfurospirillaceae bacterium]